MKYVYLLESLSNPKKHVGITQNLNERLKTHNNGNSPFTNEYKPWKIIIAIRFENDKKAAAFEKYLKDGSGHAFAKRHFW
ncbi:MAG: excinuclease ABC subunit C [Planctomycetes bacterium GWF2_41_51]|nr:MAG: excinuclease ABC subunit C [Planctomycetes bacterium GWF2_41_51]HBG27009.1 excinuclease ABC subunit C [Phycisphaerales bacterium]